MKVVIAGYGVEGQTNYQYWHDLGHEVTIADENEKPSRPIPPGVNRIVGPGAFSNLQDYDLVVRTAGLAPSKITTNAKIWSATNEFFDKCPASIIGVTGTKGKGTTASLIHSILQAGGKTSWLVGNIGAPALEILSQITPTDLVVYELSSFQLWDIEKSPHIAVVLPIEPDHLDVHKDMEDYIAAKSNISRWQTKDDTTVYYSSFYGVPKQIAGLSKGKKIPYMYQTGAYVADGYFWFGEQKLCPVDCLKLPGGHNLENACAAITAVWEFVQDGEVIAKGFGSFRGLPHRLEFVTEVDGVTYYDDSFSASTVSTQVAMQAFTAPKILIAGGYDRGIDFSDLVKAILENNLKKILLIGQTAPKLEVLFKKSGVADRVEHLGTSDMPSIVRRAAALAEAGDIVLLSPGCPSFDMFADFKERGEQFQAAVKKL